MFWEVANRESFIRSDAINFLARVVQMEVVFSTFLYQIYEEKFSLFFVMNNSLLFEMQSYWTKYVHKVCDLTLLSERLRIIYQILRYNISRIKYNQNRSRNWIQRNHWNTSLKCYFYKLSWRLGAQSRSHIYQTTSTTIHHLRPRNFLYLLECAYVCTSYGEIYYLRKYSLLWGIGSILN